MSSPGQRKKSHSKAYDVLSEYMNNSFSPELEEKVQGWLLVDRDRENKDDALYEIYDQWMTREKQEGVATGNEERAAPPAASPKKKIHTIGRRSWVGWAAAVMVIVGIGFFFLVSRGHDPVENISWITVATSEDEVQQILLPDGSEVQLKQASVLKYADDFLTDRRLMLTGEALFSVRKLEGKPFVLNSEGLKISVLGTEFNVRNYSDASSVQIDLIEGSVQVELTNQDVVLEPYTRLVFNRATKRAEVMPLHEYSVLSLKGELLHFRDVTLKEVFDRLSFRYENLEIKESPVFSHNLINVDFRDGETLEEILFVLRIIAPVFDYREADGFWTIT